MDKKHILLLLAVVLWHHDAHAMESKVAPKGMGRRVSLPWSIKLAHLKTAPVTALDATRRLFEPETLQKKRLVQGCFYDDADCLAVGCGGFTPLFQFIRYTDQFLGNEEAFAVAKLLIRYGVPVKTKHYYGRGDKTILQALRFEIDGWADYEADENEKEYYRKLLHAMQAGVKERHDMVHKVIAAGTKIAEKELDLVMTPEELAEDEREMAAIYKKLQEKYPEIYGEKKA